MATEMPIDPEFGRFIEGLQMTPDGGAEVQLPDETPDIEEMADGSAVVTMTDEFKGPTESEDFYENLAESMDIGDLNAIGLRFLDLVEKDKEARKERDKQYEDGLRRTGLGNDAPGGANFNGASKVVHPAMAEACVDFAARAVKELFPPDGPVRTNILGEVNDEKQEVAERKRDYMNWQLTDQIEEFRDEQEQMLTQLPMGGSQFMKLYWDDKLKRPCAQFIPIDNILMPFAAIMPCRSSGVVSSRTRMTASPDLAAASASSAVKYTLPTAAPGDAANPLAMALVLFANCGCNTESR